MYVPIYGSTKLEPTMPNWVVYGIHTCMYIYGRFSVPSSVSCFLSSVLSPRSLCLSLLSQLILPSSSPNLVPSYHSLLPHLQKFPYVYCHFARICSESFSLHVNSLGFQRACLSPPSRSVFIPSAPLCSFRSLYLVLFRFHF